MEEKSKVSFPKGFFTKERPVITNKEALKDVIPIKWSEDVEKDKKKTITYFTGKKSIVTDIK